MQNKPKAFKSFAAFITDTQMSANMWLNIVLLCFTAQLVITLLFSVIVYSPVWVVFAENVFYGITDNDFIPLKDAARNLFDITLPILTWTSFIWLFYPVILWKFKKLAAEQSKDKIVRGAQLIPPKQLITSTTSEPTDLPIGEVKIPIDAETKHVFIVGRPGVGKTVALTQVVARLRERQERGIIHDFKGDYVSKFFNPKTDLIFNPLDTRCVGWNVFNEINTHMDIDAIASSLIPPDQKDPFWSNAAKDVLAGILHYLYQNNLTSNAHIWHAVSAPVRDLAEWLKDTKNAEQGYRYLENLDDSKLATSVLSVLMQYLKCFQFMADIDGDFAIRDWLHNTKSGFIFVVNRPAEKETLKPILSLFIDLLSREFLSLKDDRNRRFFFILDEFGTLQRLSSIIQLLTLSRSKGGSCWIGIQDVGQIASIYTQDIRQAIVNACGNSLMFSVADPDTATFLSNKIGDVEIEETEESRSMGVDDDRSSISFARRKKTQKLILPSEIQNLKELECFLKVSNYDITKLKLAYQNYQDVAEPTIIRDAVKLEQEVPQIDLEAICQRLLA